MIRRILLEGPFTDDDVVTLSAALRECDARNPEGMFTMVAVAPDGTIAEATHILDRVPGMEFRKVIRFEQ